MGAEAEGNPPTTARRQRARDHGKGTAHLHSAVCQFLLEAVQGPPESVIWFCNFVVEILIPPMLIGIQEREGRCRPRRYYKEKMRTSASSVGTSRGVRTAERGSIADRPRFPHRGFPP
jgi:hypothetical protein